MLTKPGNEHVAQIPRAATPNSPAFKLHYIRSGPRTDTPIVVIPGGPGLASILPYRALRRWAARANLDIIMIEHRGVGCSRKDLAGNELPLSAMRIIDVLDDIAAVLDHEGANTAFIAGSSYGSYLASAFGARHPDRVAGMLLDSALQSTADLATGRERIRALFWEGSGAIAAYVRHLARAGLNERILLDVVRAAYELGGEGLLLPLLRHRLSHRRSLTWKLFEIYAARDVSISRIPGYYEFDIAGAIAFRELRFGAPGDGLPLDPAITYAPLAARFPAFSGEPYDLPAEVAQFAWPLVLLVGSRDIRTPPVTAQRLAAARRDANTPTTLVEITNGHSALDTQPMAFLTAIRSLAAGTPEALPPLRAQLDRLPPRNTAARLPGWLHAILRVETVLRRG